MEEVVGAALFESFPNESFRFIVRYGDGAGYIRLENEVIKQCWTCKVTDVGEFAPKGVMLPPNTVFHYVTASLKGSISAAERSNRDLFLVRGDEDKTLQLEVLIKLGEVDVAWAPKYVFPMSLEPQESLLPVEQIQVLATQVGELQQEVKTLKEQMKAVMRAQAASLLFPTTFESLPAFSIRPRRSSFPVQPASTKAEAAPSSTCREQQVWGDIVSQPHHKLVQIEEYRETQNASGKIERRHRQHTCKVCSALRGDRRRPSQTCYYCAECTEQHEGGVIFLCDKVRHHEAEEYQNATCSQIWHVMWNNGMDMPQSGISTIRMRKKLKSSASNDG